MSEKDIVEMASDVAASAFRVENAIQKQMLPYEVAAEISSSLNMINESVAEIKCASIRKATDEYHSLQELYNHRNHLFLLACKAQKDRAWWSRKHHDGSGEDGWVIAGLWTDYGDITYHMKEEFIPLLESIGVVEFETAPEWDGHTPDDVINTIREVLSGVPVNTHLDPEYAAKLRESVSNEQ